MKTHLPMNRLPLAASLVAIGLLAWTPCVTAAPDDPFAPPPPPAYDDEWSAPEAEPTPPAPQDRWTTPPDQLGPDAGLDTDRSEPEAAERNEATKQLYQAGISYVDHELGREELGDARRVGYFPAMML